MDVQRTDLKRQKKRKRTLLIGVALAAVLLVTIGLVLSRQIAEAHGGSLTVENRIGHRGCCARLRLPLS